MCGYVLLCSVYVMIYVRCVGCCGLGLCVACGLALLCCVLFAVLCGFDIWGVVGLLFVVLCLFCVALDLRGVLCCVLLWRSV